MDVLDIPRRLLSLLPFVGGSNEPARPAPEAKRTPPAAEDSKVDEQPPVAEDDDQFDDPDEVDEDEDEDEELDEDEESEDEDPDEDEPEAEADEDEAEAAEETGGGEPDEPEDDEPDGVDDEPDSDEDADEDDNTVDISGTTAPSIGPNTVIVKVPPAERLARGSQSDTDAMGLEKRREVIGGNYNAGFGKQLIRWAVVIVVIAGAGFGAKLLVDDLDKAPAKAADRAPWADNHEAPAPLE